MRYSLNDAQICISERSGRLHIRWTAADGPTFQAVRASFRSEFGHHGEAVWLADDRCWSMPLWLGPRLEQWLGRLFEPEAVQWERPSYTRAYSRRYERAEARTPAPLAGALRTLHLTPDAPLELAEHVYRWHAKHTHPDAGGNHEAACAVNEAISIIREHQEGAA